MSKILRTLFIFLFVVSIFLGLSSFSNVSAEEDCKPGDFNAVKCARCMENKKWGSNCTDYGPDEGELKGQWCACALSCKDGGSLVKNQCPQANPRTCFTDCSKCEIKEVCGVQTYDTCQDQEGNLSSTNEFCKKPGSKFKCFASENNKCVSDISGGYNYSCSACNLGENQVQVKEVLINDKPIAVEVGGKLKFNLAISDLTKESLVPVKVTVKYNDDTTKVFTLSANYKPKNSNEYLVDVIVHKSLPNQDEAANWARETINNVTNTSFGNAGINKKLKVDKIITAYDELAGCPQGSELKVISDKKICDFNQDNKIRVWLYKSGYRDANNGVPNISAAVPVLTQVWLFIPNDSNLPGGEPFGLIDKRSLTHELGHIFGLPDYYLENVSKNKNEIVPLEIQSHVKDIMWDPIRYDYFSETSKNIVNQLQQIPIQQRTFEYLEKYIPLKVILKLFDENNKPMPYVKVEIFPQVIPFVPNTLTDINNIRIPDVVSFDGFTNEKGEVELGDYKNLFKHKKVSSEIPGRSVLIRFTQDNKIRYGAITTSYLNKLYFQGNRDSGIVIFRFNELVEYQPGTVRVLSLPKSLDGENMSLPAKEQENLNKHVIDGLKINMFSK